MYKLIVQTIDDGILLLSVVGSNQQYLLDYGINFASSKGYRRSEVEINVTNFPEKYQRKSFSERVIHTF